METQKLIIIDLSDLRKASDNRNYFVATFSSGFGQKVVKRTFWEQFKKDAAGNNLTEKYWERGSYDQAMGLLSSGEAIEGNRVTRTVEPYMIGEGENQRSVNTYTTVVFPGESVESVFTAADHNIVDTESGEILKKKAILSAGVTKKVSAEA